MNKTTFQYINRDLSWLSFNSRVLEEASDRSLPLYERLKFLVIYSSNLDEFYKVRVASYRRMLSQSAKYPDVDESKRLDASFSIPLYPFIPKEKEKSGHR